MSKVKTISQHTATYRARQRKQWTASIAHDRAEGYEAGYTAAIRHVQDILDKGVIKSGTLNDVEVFIQEVSR